MLLLKILILIHNIMIYFFKTDEKMDKLKACLFHFRTTFRTSIIIMHFGTGHTVTAKSATMFVNHIIGGNGVPIQSQSVHFPPSNIS